MGRKTAYRYRCSHDRCRTRRTLVKPLEHYVREPRCRCCGGPLTLDRYRNTQELAPDRVCRCDGYWFPHRRGGGVWCIHHPTGPTDEDYRERYGPDCMETT